MERLLHHVHLSLREQYSTAIVGPAGCQDHLEPGTAFSCCPPMPPARFLIHCQLRTCGMAMRFRPDLILAGSGVTAPAARLAGTLVRAPVACFAHGLDLVVPNLGYRLGFLPAIRSCDRVIVNSQSTARIAIDTGVAPSRIRILHPGVHIPSSPDYRPDGSLFRESIGAGARPILLSVGRLTERKGIVQFIDHCLPEIAARIPEILYVVIGNEPKHALNGGTGMLRRILQTVKERRLQEHVLIIREADDALLWQAYAASQLFIFPVMERPGDVEGFGMVAVEAAAHGLPTVAFATGGVVDAVKDGVSGYLIRPGDYVGMTRAVENHLAGGQGKGLSASCLQFSERFSWDLFGRHLRKICSETITSDGRI